MSGHGHGHGHGHGCCAAHGDEASGADLSSEYSLYVKINLAQVQCLNEAQEGSGKLVFKPWNERLDREKFVASDVDEELLFNIPFTGNVKLKSIIVIGGEDTEHPNKMRLFKNVPGMTFDNTGSEPTQEFELHPDPNGVLEYHTKVARFSSVTHLSIHFPGNGGAESTRIYYIGLKGDFTEEKRQEIGVITYEATPNPADHKTNALDSVGHMIQ